MKTVETAWREPFLFFLSLEVIIGVESQYKKIIVKRTKCVCATDVFFRVISFELNCGAEIYK